MSRKSILTAVTALVIACGLSFAARTPKGAEQVVKPACGQVLTVGTSC